MLPAFTTEISEVPSTFQSAWASGAAARAAPHPPLGAVVNAIVDALSKLGVEHIEPPVTPERVWRAIRSAGR